MYNMRRFGDTMPLSRKNMPAIRTFARPVDDRVTVSVPREYCSYSFEVLLVPVAGQSPSWARLCEDAITKNADGPHDMDSIRESIKTAERLSVVCRQNGQGVKYAYSND